MHVCVWGGWGGVGGRTHNFVRREPSVLQNTFLSAFLINTYVSICSKAAPNFCLHVYKRDLT